MTTTISSPRRHTLCGFPTPIVGTLAAHQAAARFRRKHRRRRLPWSPARESSRTRAPPTAEPTLPKQGSHASRGFGPTGSRSSTFWARSWQPSRVDTQGRPLAPCEVEADRRCHNERIGRVLAQARNSFRPCTEGRSSALESGLASGRREAQARGLAQPPPRRPSPGRRVSARGPGESCASDALEQA